MKSIDRLREYAETKCGWGVSPEVARHIKEFADAIDAEYQKAEDEWKAKDGQSWLHGYAECRAELMEGNDVIAEDLEKAGWVKLPVDADGEPIHVGDVMEWPDTSTAEVVGIGDDRFFYADDGLRYAWASDKIHHHAPTVEDVLREFAEKITDSQIPGVHPTYEEAIVEYAAKLRLADHAEA